MPILFTCRHESRIPPALTLRWLRTKRIPQFGLVAEEVEKLNRALVAYDDHGKP